MLSPNRVASILGVHVRTCINIPLAQVEVDGRANVARWRAVLFEAAAMPNEATRIPRATLVTRAGMASVTTTKRSERNRTANWSDGRGRRPIDSPKMFGDYTLLLPRGCSPVGVLDEEATPLKTYGGHGFYVINGRLMPQTGNEYGWPRQP